MDEVPSNQGSEAKPLRRWKLDSSDKFASDFYCQPGVFSSGC
jgi:hypothetical protein